MGMAINKSIANPVGRKNQKNVRCFIICVFYAVIMEKWWGT